MKTELTQGDQIRGSGCLEHVCAQAGPMSLQVIVLNTMNQTPNQPNKNVGPSIRYYDSSLCLLLICF